MRSRLAKCCFCNGSKIEKDFETKEMACKNTCKNAYSSERKRSDIFPPFGVPLCALDLQNAAFATEKTLKKGLKK